MRLFLLALIAIALVLPRASIAGAEQLSALIGQALDRQLPKSDIEFTGTLPEALTSFGDLTGVRIEASDAAYDALPWGDLTPFSAKFQNQTLRQALDAICQKLGLEYELGNDAVELRPIAALVRLGRRCTVEELQELDFLRQTQLDSSDLHPSAGRLLALVDERLHASPYAVENRAFLDTDATPVSLARNSTLFDALEEISQQTHATWYPWGKTIVVLSKPDQIRMQLSRRITARFNGQEISNVLLDLSRQSGVEFSIEPGAIQKIDPQFRRLRLELDNASVQQALESIAGFTGLGYNVTDNGVHIFYAATALTTQSSN
jgi:hypothetical protein